MKLRIQPDSLCQNLTGSLMDKNGSRPAMEMSVRRRLGRSGSTRGFTILELLIVIGIGLTVTAMAYVLLQNSLNSTKSDSALQIALGQIRQVHERAIDERHQYQLTFTAPRTIQTDRIDVDPVTKAKTPVFIGTIDLPRDVSFAIVSGTPATGTPNGLGSAANAIDLSVNNATGITQVYFQADGRVLDSLGRVADGIVYMSRTGDLTSTRAVTVFGATGRVKGWKLQKNGSVISWGQV
jgi:prepilin-type N-terminal cleavage/methylation domain-containing protein